MSENVNIEDEASQATVSELNLWIHLSMLKQPKKNLRMKYLHDFLTINSIFRPYHAE